LRQLYTKELTVMNAYEHLAQAKESMAADVAALRFEGTTVVGRHGLVSIDLMTGKLKVRTAPDGKPICCLNLPTSTGVEASRCMERVMLQLMPYLGSCAAMDDLTAVLWAFINIRLLEHPLSLETIKLSPEAAAYFESRFPR
jgi:hypothetical protein